jgi:hypothetical protein
MFTSHPRPRWGWVEQMAMLLAAICVSLLMLCATASAGRSPAPTATIARSELRTALAQRATASHALASSSKRLRRCLHAHPRHPRRCRAAKRATRRAALRLATAKRRANNLAAQIARASHQSPSKQGPTLTVSGEALSWNAIADVSSYVLATKLPGQSTKYSTVAGTSTTPPAVPGTTVSYSVRTNVKGSAWSAEVSIAYPAAVSAPESGTTIETTTPPTTTSAANPLEMGVVAGSLPFIQQLGAHTARMEFGIGTPASHLAPVIEAYARAGIRPLLLAGFYGRLPTAAEAQNLASWAAEFGPGGTFWQGKSLPTGTAVTSIEFGNETSYSYQFTDNSTSAYASRAQTYALRLKEAHEAIQAVNPNVGLLAQADDGDNNSSEWVDNMFAAVPNLGQIVAGWTIHPYGPGWEVRINRLISQTNAVGAPSTIPIDITEWGLATDNGRCLSDNYGFNKCMNYQEATTTLQSNLEGMRSRYGSRLASFYLYEAQDEEATGTSTEREGYFGALQSNGAPKGTYTTTVQSLLTTNP